MGKMIIGLLTFVLFLGLGRVARADDDAVFRQTLDEAMEHYKAKRYEQAIQSFEAAYKLRPEPELVYNVARSYEKSLKRSEAIAAYERFLELPGTTAELRANALASIEALKKEQAALGKRSADKPEAPALRDAPPGGRETSEPTRADATVERSHAAEWALVGGGLGVAAIGGVFTALAFKANSDFDKATSRTDKVAYRDDTKRNALVADVMVGVGLVGAAIGAGLLIFRDSGDERVGVVPNVSSGSAGLDLVGRF